MVNLAVALMILLYIGICFVVVSSWVFRTIDDQQTEVEDSIDESFDDDYFESGDLL
tara:strand:+ start:921 stop:1088 length:168 start_codon:yes stop_codon:yes gene_type:complete